MNQTEYEAQQKKLARRRALADQMSAEAMAPWAGPQMVSGRVVKQGALQPLAQLAKGFMGAYSGRKVEKESEALDTTRSADITKAIEEYRRLQGDASANPQARQQALDNLAGQTMSDSDYAKMQVAQEMTPRPGFTLASGETRYDASGKPVASVAPVAKPPPDAGFSLAPGQTRYDASGKVIAAATPDTQKPTAQFIALTPQEIAAAGLPAGTSAQRDAATGKIDVLSKRDMTGALSQKDATMAKQKLNTVKLARQQVAAIKDAFETGRKGMNAFGPGQALLPTEQGKLFDSRVDQMRSTLSSLTRVPGIGAQSDYEARLDQGKFPTRGDYESVTADKIAQLDAMLGTIETGYENLLNAGATDTGAADSSAPSSTQIGAPGASGEPVNSEHARGSDGASQGRRVHHARRTAKGALMSDPFAQFQDAPAETDPFAQFSDADAEEPTKNPPKRGFLGELKRQAGLGARALTQGVTDLAGLPADLAVQLYNVGNNEPYEVTLDDGSKAMRGGPLPLPSAEREKTLTAAGLPEPETATERVVNLAGRSAAGGGSGAALAAKSPGVIAKMLAARPGLQVASGATSGGSAGLAKEKGVGPVGQTLAGLAGAITPALLTARVPVGAVPGSGAPQAQARAAAEASAEAQITPGAAAAENTANIVHEVRATTASPNFGAIGPDESAGLNSSMADIAKRGQAIGMRMTPGQATGSKKLQQLEAMLESHPMTSGPFNKIKARNATVVNRAAAHAIGETADVVDSGVLARASDRISGVYENVADDVARPIDPQQFTTFLTGLLDETRGLVKGLTSEPLVEDITKFAADGSANGRQLQSLGSKLGKAAYKNMSTPSGDRDLGIALYQVKDYVDELLAQGLSPERATKFQEARGQYRNLMLLTQRVGVTNPDTGNVSGRSLSNLLQSKDKQGYLYGKNRSPLYESARFSRAFAPIVGDSGTATRMAPQGLTDLAIRATVGTAGRAYASSPGVNLALKAQAGARAAGGAARSMGQPLGSADIPAAGAAAGAASQMTEEEQRRAMIAELLGLQGN